MGPIRQAARRAVEALDIHPEMFETGGASDEAARRTLLSRVASCDALLLLLGREYGERGRGDASPTEEEFNEARERGLPVLALVQDSDREPAQDEFLARVRGNWAAGRLTADFTDVTDVGFAVTKALNGWRRTREGGAAAPAADEKATGLARGEEHRGYFQSGGSKLRVAVVPALDRLLLDAVALRDSQLLDDLAGAARTSRLAPQSVAIQADPGRDSITLTLSGGGGSEQSVLRVGFDGSVVGEGPVAGEQAAFGGSVVMADRAREVMQRTMSFAEAVWQRIDQRDEVRDVSIACAVPRAEHKVYALEPLGNSMSMPMGMPPTLVAPEPPLRGRRADLPRLVDRLEAELHRAFELAGAVHPQAAGRSTRTW